MAGRRQRHTHTSLPTRLHRWLVADRDTHIHPCLQDCTDGWSPAKTHTYIPASMTAQMAGRRRDTHIHPCLQDRTDGWLPAETHTYIPAYKTAQMAGRRQRHTHTSLPTRPHRWLVAGRDTQNRYECLSAGTVSMMSNYTSEAEGSCSRRLALKTGAAVCTSKVPGVSPVFGNPYISCCVYIQNDQVSFPSRVKTTHHQHCLMLGKFHDRLSSRNTNAFCR